MGGGEREEGKYLTRADFIEGYERPCLGEHGSCEILFRADEGDEDRGEEELRDER